jgi:peptidoglycan/LPS O-acetylase OafA/YrhL
MSVATWPKRVGLFQAGVSVGEILQRSAGLSAGFDYLRTGLALAIFTIHVGGIIHGRSSLGVSPMIADDQVVFDLWASWRPLRNAISFTFVPMFFALSGFLVTASAFRLRDARSFLLFRALRIIPALAVEVVLSAIVLGAIFTNRSLTQYFSDPEFFRYFGNIFGFVSFTLPGVFENCALPKMINANLWTLPFEFYCYLIFLVGMLSSIVYNRSKFTAIFIITSATLIVINYYVGFEGEREDEYIRGIEIIYYFFVGCFFYHWRNNIPVNYAALIVAAALACILIPFKSTMFIAPVFLVYATVVLGVIDWPDIRTLRSGDYSYGIYLYGFPITQAVVAAMPDLRGHSIVLRVISTVLTIAFAACSWHLLERRALKLKKLVRRL